MRPTRLILPALLALAALPATAAAVVPVPSWSEEQLVSPIGEQPTVDPPLVVFDGDGGITTVWLASVSGPALQLRAAHRAPGGSWQEPVNVGAPSSSINLPRRGLTLAPNGDVTLVYTAATGGHNVVYSTLHSAANGGWGEPTALSPLDTNSDSPTVQAAPDSSVWAAWSEAADGGTRVRAGHARSGQLRMDHQRVPVCRRRHRRLGRHRRGAER